MALVTSKTGIVRTEATATAAWKKSLSGRQGWRAVASAEDGLELFGFEHQSVQELLQELRAVSSQTATQSYAPAQEALDLTSPDAENGKGCNNFQPLDMMKVLDRQDAIESALVNANSGASRRGSLHGRQEESGGMAASVCSSTPENKRLGKLQLPSRKRRKQSLVCSGSGTVQATVPDNDETGHIDRESVALGKNGRHHNPAPTSETQEPSSGTYCNKKRQGADCCTDGSDLEYRSSQGNVFIRSRSRPVLAKRSKFAVAPCRTNHLGVATTLPSDVDVDLDMDTDPEPDAGVEQAGDLIESRSQFEMSAGQQAANDMMAIFLPTLPLRRNRPVNPEPVSISNASAFHRASTQGDVGPAMNEESTTCELFDKTEGSPRGPSQIATLQRPSSSPCPVLNEDCINRSTLYENVVGLDNVDSAEMGFPASIPSSYQKDVPKDHIGQLGEQHDQQAFAIENGLHRTFSTTGALQSETEALLLKQTDEPAREQVQSACNNGKLESSSNLRGMGGISMDDCISKEAEGLRAQSTSMHTGDDPQVQTVEWWTTDLNPEDLYSSQELIEVVAGCVGKDRLSKQGSEKPHELELYVPQELESVCVPQLPASKDVVRSTAPQCIGHFLCPSPVVFMILRVGQNTIHLCVCCADAEEGSRRLFIFRSEDSASGDIEFDLVTSFTFGIKQNSVVQEEQGLLFTPDGKGIIMLDYFGLPNTRHCATYSHGLQIVAFNNKEVWLQAMLRCSTAMRCIIAPEPLLVIAAGTYGHVNCWIMDPTWKFCQEVFELPSKDSGTSTVTELLIVPGSPHHIVGCTSEGVFAMWDYRQRVLLKLFGSPQPDLFLLRAHFLDFVPSASTNEDSAKRRPALNIDFCFLVCTSSLIDAGDHSTRFHNTELKRQSYRYAAAKGDEVFLGRPLDDRASAASTVGPCAIIGTDDGEAYAVDTISGAKLLQFLELKGSPITSVATDRSEGIFATASKDGRVSVYSSIRDCI